MLLKKQNKNKKTFVFFLFLPQPVLVIVHRRHPEIKHKIKFRQHYWHSIRIQVFNQNLDRGGMAEK